MLKGRSSLLGFIQSPAMASWPWVCSAGLAVNFLLSGTIPWNEILFAAMAGLYIVVIAKLAYPPVTAAPPSPAFQGSQLKALKRYVSLAAIIGLLLPTLQLALYRSAARQSVPHTSLLIFQIVGERITASLGPAASFPARAAVPIVFNARRLFSIWDWLAAEEFGRWPWYLAMANMALWSFNLFVFLVPVYLPIAMRTYYRQEMKNSGSNSGSNSGPNSGSD